MSSSKISSYCCTALGDIDVEEFGLRAVARNFTRVAKRGEPQWWLSLDVCCNCGQHWLVAQEERFNDVYVLSRVSEAQAQVIVVQNVWPSTFDHYEALLLLGAERGHSTRYAYSEELLPIAIDLVGQRPGISEVELGQLLSLSSGDAIRLLLRANEEVDRNGYPYPWRLKR
jgi:hypothetical protein